MERNILNRRQLVISCGEQQRGQKVSLHRFRSRPLLVMVGRFEYHEHHSAGRKHGKIISKLIQHTCTKHTLILFGLYLWIRSTHWYSSSICSATLSSKQFSRKGDNFNHSYCILLGCIDNIIRPILKHFYYPPVS